MAAIVLGAKGIFGLIDELTLLRLVANKGRVPAESVAVSLGLDASEVETQLDDYTSRGLVKTTPTGFRVTPAGRQRCAKLVVAEHLDSDTAAITQIYATFDSLNSALKAIITDWQLRGPDLLNDHGDSDYDEAVLDRLSTLHAEVLPLLDRITDAAPRLLHYRSRLCAAAERVAAGDHVFVAKPITDSYHTVWFEMHEDLIGLAGLTRADEAEAGRGA